MAEDRFAAELCKEVAEVEGVIFADRRCAACPLSDAEGNLGDEVLGGSESMVFQTWCLNVYKAPRAGRLRGGIASSVVKSGSREFCSPGAWMRRVCTQSRCRKCQEYCFCKCESRLKNRPRSPCRRRVLARERTNERSSGCMRAKSTAAGRCPWFLCSAVRIQALGCEGQSDRAL